MSKHEDYLQLPDRVVNSPHEDAEEGFRGPEQLPLGVLHLDALRLRRGRGLRRGHGGRGRGEDRLRTQGVGNTRRSHLQGN